MIEYFYVVLRWKTHVIFVQRVVWIFLNMFFLSFKGFSIYKFTLQIIYGALQVFPEHKGKKGVS